MPYLSSYKLMWMIVLFDLPVVTKSERKQAAEFRKNLLEMGFHMSQFSVYYRLVSGREAMEPYINKIQSKLPVNGKVDIIGITDKQYGDIISFNGRRYDKKRKKNEDDCAQYLQF